MTTEQDRLQSQHLPSSNSLPCVRSHCSVLRVLQQHTFLTRLIVVSFGRRKWGKHWWCGSVLLSLLLHFFQWTFGDFRGLFELEWDRLVSHIGPSAETDVDPIVTLGTDVASIGITAKSTEGESEFVV